MANKPKGGLVLPSVKFLEERGYMIISSSNEKRKKVGENWFLTAPDSNKSEYVTDVYVMNLAKELGFSHKTMAKGGDLHKERDGVKYYDIGDNLDYPVDIKAGDVIEKAGGNILYKVLKTWDGYEAGQTSRPVVYASIQELKKNGEVKVSARPITEPVKFKYENGGHINSVGSDLSDQMFGVDPTIQEIESGEVVVFEPIEFPSEMAKGGSFTKCPVGTEVQTLIFSKDLFNEAEAKKWAHKHDFKYGYVDKKENTFRIRQQEPALFDEQGFRTIELMDGVQAVIGCPKHKKMAEGGSVHGNPFELYDTDKAAMNRATRMIKEAIKAGDLYVKGNHLYDKVDILEAYRKTGASDTASREAVARYIYSKKMEDGGAVGVSKSEFDSWLKQAFKEANKWHFYNQTVDGIPVKMKFFIGAKEVDVEVFSINGLHVSLPRNYAGKRDTLAMILDEVNKQKFAKGGSVVPKFDFTNEEWESLRDVFNGSFKKETNAIYPKYGEAYNEVSYTSSFFPENKITKEDGSWVIDGMSGKYKTLQSAKNNLYVRYRSGVGETKGYAKGGAVEGEWVLCDTDKNELISVHPSYAAAKRALDKEWEKNDANQLGIQSKAHWDEMQKYVRGKGRYTEYTAVFQKGNQWKIVTAYGKTRDDAIRDAMLSRASNGIDNSFELIRIEPSEPASYAKGGAIEDQKKQFIEAVYKAAGLNPDKIIRAKKDDGYFVYYRYADHLYKPVPHDLILDGLDYKYELRGYISKARQRAGLSDPIDLDAIIKEQESKYKFEGGGSVGAWKEYETEYGESVKGYISTWNMGSGKYDGLPVVYGVAEEGMSGVKSYIVGGGILVDGVLVNYSEAWDDWFGEEAAALEVAKELAANQNAFSEYEKGGSIRFDVNMFSSNKHVTASLRSVLSRVLTAAKKATDPHTLETSGQYYFVTLMKQALTELKKQNPAIPATLEVGYYDGKAFARYSMYEVYKTFDVDALIPSEYAKGGGISKLYRLVPYKDRGGNYVEMVAEKQQRYEGVYDGAVAEATQMLASNPEFVEVEISTIGKTVLSGKKIAKVTRDGAIKFADGGDVEQFSRPQIGAVQTVRLDEAAPKFAKGGSIFLSHDKYDLRYHLGEDLTTMFRDFFVKLGGRVEKKPLMNFIDGLNPKVKKEYLKAFTEYKKIGQVYEKDGCFINPILYENSELEFLDNEIQNISDTYDVLLGMIGEADKVETDQIEKELVAERKALDELHIRRNRLLS